jgi:hypothetical protein
MNNRFNSNEFLKKLSLSKKKLFDDMRRGDVNPFSNEQNSNPSHFIYEIIQNAEDEGAKSICFNLSNDRLEIVHNGKVFNREDVKYITAYGESEKRKKPGYIGKFGMGFKSVFSVTGSPRIESGEFYFELKNYFVPYPLSPSPITKRHHDTKITLPFNHKERNREETFNLIDSKLRNLEPHVLLFLKSLNSIKWMVNKDKRNYYKNETTLKKFVKRVKLSSDNNHEEYLVLEKRVEVKRKKTSVKIAFRLEGGGKVMKKIIPVEISKLIVFFPTEQDTYLKFFIHGPYLTNQSRESILTNNEENKILIEKTAQLIAESLKIIKRLKLLNIDFLNCLPINPDSANKSPVYLEDYKSVLSEFKSGRQYFPTNGKRFVSVGNSLLSKSRDLINILKNKDIMVLFKKSAWVNSNITKDKTPELRNYLANELGVDEKGLNDLAEVIDASFLQNKSDKWIINFYRILNHHENLWKKKDNKWEDSAPLRMKPIIRLEDGSQAVPFGEKDNALVYLPTVGMQTEYRTVKKKLAKNREVFTFLKNLGLTKPTLLAEIQEYILPRYKNNHKISDSKNLEDVKKLMTLFERGGTGEGEAVIENLKILPILKARNPHTKIVQFRYPIELYFPELENYFSNYDKTFFVDLEFYKCLDRNKFRDFLHKIGVEDKPRRIPIDGTIDSEQKVKLREKSGDKRINWTSEERTEDYVLEGLDEALKNITKESSINLWKILLSLPDDYYGACYFWRYKNSDRLQKFEVKFLKPLRESKWMLGRDGKLVEPYKISKNDLSTEYELETPEAQRLIQRLNLKTEVQEQYLESLPAGKRELAAECLDLINSGKLSKEDIEQLKEKKMNPESELAELIEMDTTSGEEPPFIPEEVEITSELFESVADENKRNKVKSLTMQNGNFLSPEDSEKGTDETMNNRSNSDLNKQIGDWGEECVYLYLKNEYKDSGKIAESKNGFTVINENGNATAEVRWLNIDSQKGIGCDFIIKDEEKILKYIEVKSKTKEGAESIEVTGAQWRLAEKEQDKYWIYCVQGARSKNPNIVLIQNPVKKWRDGIIEAGPICLKI